MNNHEIELPDGQINFEMIGSTNEKLSIKVWNEPHNPNDLTIQIDDINGSKVITVNGRTFNSAVNAIMKFMEN